MIKALSITTKLLSVLAVAGAMAGVLAEPVAAQTASKLRCTGCVKSKNMKRTINLGSRNGRDGNFSVLSSAREKTVVLDGDSGNVTNSLTGNGVVKAWARIADNGTVVSCWRCNMDPAVTRLLSPGRYKVDFTPLSADIADRPRSISIDFHDGAGAFSKTIGVWPASDGDLSAVYVGIGDFVSVTESSESFTVLIY